MLPRICIATSDSSIDFVKAIMSVLALSDAESKKLYHPFLEKFSPETFLSTFFAVFGEDPNNVA